MAEFVEVEQAIGMSGLRVVLAPGIPGPFSEAAKGILYIKKIPFVRVRHETGGENRALMEWTKQTSAPVFVYNDERPRSIWSDQLFLCERLGPEPSLIPAKMDDRVRMFGLSNEICGENGFGWSRRLMMLYGAITNPAATEDVKARALRFGAKYGYSATAAMAAPARAAMVLKALGAQLDDQRSRGSRFMIGDRLSALDIYWAVFAALLQPLPEDLCKMSAAFRQNYTCTNPEVMAAVSPELLAHRDFIYHEYLQLPLDL